MVEAFKLGDAASPGEGAGELDRQHDGLGAGVREADLLDRVDPVDQQLGQPNFRLDRLGEGRALPDLLGERPRDVGVGVAVDQGGHVVEEVKAFDALDIGDRGAGAGGGKDRVGRKVIVKARSPADHRAGGALVEPCGL